MTSASVSRERHVDAEGLVHAPTSPGIALPSKAITPISPKDQTMRSFLHRRYRLSVVAVAVVTAGPLAAHGGS